MRLDASEFGEMARLMAKARQGRPLGASGEQRLRALLAKEEPNAVTMRVDELLHLGVIVIGLAVVFGEAPALA